jgi:flavin-binding protein dodecin
MLLMTSGQEGEMAEEAEGRYTGTSFDSFQAAADEALSQVPPGPEGIKKGRIATQDMREGGVVGRRQYVVTIVGASSETDDGESSYS